ncbi:hypothetical protein ScPMuIL_002617 [Solemya velum]
METDGVERKRLESLLTEECVRSIRAIKKSLEARDFVDNILLVGTPGVGKSSFINAIRAALSGRWLDKAHSGSYGRDGKAMTVCLTWYLRCGLDEVPTCINHHNVPHIGDMAGLGDVNTKKLQVVLSLLIDGHIGPKTNILDLLNEDIDIEELPMMFKQRRKKWRVKKIIFVASATENLPENLIDCVLNVVRSDIGHRPRWIPLYGVMTKVDLVVDGAPDNRNSEAQSGVREVVITKDDFEEKERLFIQKLGINKFKYMRWQNYRDEGDYPNLNINAVVLSFLEKLCTDTEDECIYPKPLEFPLKDILEMRFRRTLRSTKRFISNNMMSQKHQYLLIPILLVIIAVILWTLLSTSGAVVQDSVTKSTEEQDRLHSEAEEQQAPS